MVKILITLIVGIVVITVYVAVLGAANATAIGSQTMTILNIVPVFIGLAMLAMIAAFAVKAYGDKGGM